MEYFKKFLKWILEVTGAGAFANNTLMCSGMIVIESVMCLVLGYAAWNAYGIIMVNQKKQDVYSLHIDKLMYSGVAYYVLKFIDAYLYAKCI